MYLRALRSRNHLSQSDLAVAVGMKQSRISLMENPDYQNYSIAVLKRVAAYFEVMLDVRFISFRRYFEELQNSSPDDLAPIAFDPLATFPAFEPAATTSVQPPIPQKPASSMDFINPSRHNDNPFRVVAP
jgi:transcriptional regulator with XRE-family HTH domain